MLPRKRYNMNVILLLILMFAKHSQQYGSGAPPMACIDQTPRHSEIPAQSSVPPYSLIPSSSQVRQGDVLNITIGSPFGAPTPIGGFILQAREIQDMEKIVGQFVKVPSDDLAQIESCRGQNDTVTHTNPEDKKPLTVTWKAPEDFLGGIAFRATVAQSYATFWKNVESPLIEVVTADAVITTTAPASATTSRAKQQPPVIMETKPKPTTAPFDIIYQGCADSKLCFGVPQNCVKNGNCKAVLAIFVAGDSYTFEVQATDNPKYVAAGLSMDNKMGDDSAMECVNDNGRIKLFASWTYPKAEPYVSRFDSPQDIVQLLESSAIDGKLYCKFKRNTVSTVKEQVFDLANKKYNLMVLAGDSMKDADRVGFHNLAYEASNNPLSLSTVGTAAGASKILLKLHGCFMICAWLGAASLGIVMARYFKKTWVGKTLGGTDIWFAYHRILMMVTWLLTVIGFILILTEVGGWQDTGENPHAITGLVTVILCFLQPIGAYFRPHPGTKRRPLFNWMHWLVGNSAHILGIATIFLAVYLQKAELPPWSVYVLAAFVVFHIITHVVLSLTVCVSEGRISNGRVNTFPMKDMLGHTRQATAVDRSSDAPFSVFRKHLLGVYAPIVLLFVIAMICLVALAPIGDTYNNLMGA